MLGTWDSLHYIIFQNFVNLATFKISYLKKRKWRKLMLMNTFCVLGNNMTYVMTVLMHHL